MLANVIVCRAYRPVKTPASPEQPATTTILARACPARLRQPSTRDRSDGELRELRVRFANTRYRVLYQRSENLMVLLHALEKDTEAVPQADIDLAKQLMADFKCRMDALRRRPPRAAGKDAPPASRPS